MTHPLAGGVSGRKRSSDAAWILRATLGVALAVPQPNRVGLCSVAMAEWQATATAEEGLELVESS